MTLGSKLTRKYPCFIKRIRLIASGVSNMRGAFNKLHIQIGVTISGP